MFGFVVSCHLWRLTDCKIQNMKAAERKKLQKSVEQYCEANGLRFTEPRRHVLDIIARAKTAIGAYDILDALGQYLDKPKPPTAYRAIEFLQEHGFVHRIESLNAYVICHADHKHSGSQFMICDSCGTVIEAHLCSVPDDLKKRVNQEGFVLSSWNAELHGQCVKCA